MKICDHCGIEAMSGDLCVGVVSKENENCHYAYQPMVCQLCTPCAEKLYKTIIAFVVNFRRKPMQTTLVPKDDDVIVSSRGASWNGESITIGRTP